mgnify:CR=1 FL=1
MKREELYARFEELDKRASQGGGPDKIEKQHASGRMTARERIDMLLDKDTFCEIDKFVNHRCTRFGMDKKQIPGDGVVCGHGKIDGRQVFVYAYDFTVHGGSLSETNAAKIVKVQTLALKSGAPIIGLNDSGGARIQEGITSLAGYASIFYQNTMASGVIPQLTAILGPCAGGACYSPALTDFIFMVNENSHMFITGPDVVKAVTNEVVDKEELGGAYTHSSKSGVAHFVYPTEEETLMQLRELLSFLPSNNMEDAPIVPCSDDANRRVESLQTVIPEDPNQPYDIKDVIEPVVDNQYFFEVMPHFAKNIVIGFARLGGQTVGIIANQPAFLAGVLDIDASDKAARFIRFCDSFNIPIITLEDMPGYLPLAQNAALSELFAANVPVCAPGLAVERGLPFCGSTDMGDVSYLLPVIQPTVSGFSGAAHSRDFAVADEALAYLAPAKLMAATVIDLLAGGAAKGRSVLADAPRRTRDEYSALWRDILAQPGEG